MADRPIETPFLIAETPRAGSLGFRWLVPFDTDGLEETLQAFVRWGKEQVPGRNFLAVSREVTQVAANEAVRQAPEVLVLVGVAVGKLEEGQEDRLRRALDELLVNDVEPLVTGDGINWNVEGRDVFVVCPELSEWMERSKFADLPTTPVDRGPLVIRAWHKWLTRKRLRVAGWAATAAATLFLLACLGVWFLPYLPRSPKPDPEVVSPSDDEFDRHKFRDALKILADRCGTDQEALVKDLQRAVDSGRTGDPIDDLYRCEELRSELETCYRQRESAPAIDPYLFISKARTRHIGPFYGGNNPDLRQTLKVRTTLAELGQALSKLREELEGAPLQWFSAKDRKFLKLLTFCRDHVLPKFPKNEYDQEVAGPFFAKSDEAVVMALLDVFSERSPLSDALPGEQLKAFYSGQAPYESLRAVSENRDQISRAITAEINDIHKDHWLEKDYRSVEDAYRALGSFFKTVADVMSRSGEHSAQSP